MQVILLAAGQSTRLQPIQDKNLLEFNGITLIEHQVLTLKKAGLEEVVVVANKFNINKITEVLSKYSSVIVTEQKDLDEGMKGGTLACVPMINQKKVLILNTNDIFEEVIFKDVIAASQQSELAGVIAGKEMNEYFPGGYLKLDESNLVTDIIEKPGAGNEPSKLVNLVCHIFNDFPTFTEYLESAQSQNDDKYEVALDDYIKKGGAKILAHKYTGSWQAIKYPWHIFKVMNHFLNTQETNIDSSAEIAPTAIIEGNVRIEKNVKVLHNAVIKGPAYIGEGSIIANNSLVRDSMIGRNCVVGFTTEVARSYLNHDVWMHSNYIGDSIIDSNVSFGAGTVLGNLRFDEANVKVKIKEERLDSGTNKLGAIIGSGVRFGINASTNPGVKIGKNCFIGGNVLVEKDLDNGKLALLDQTLKISENQQTASIDDRDEMKKKLS